MPPLTTQQASSFFGTNVCNWPSWLQGPLFQMFPGVAAACSAGHVVNEQDLKKFSREAVGGTPGANAGSGNPLTGLTAIGDLAQRLTQASTWVRVAEFAAGGILLFVGINAALRNTAGGSAVRHATKTVTKTAKKVVK